MFLQKATTLLQQTEDIQEGMMADFILFDMCEKCTVLKCSFFVSSMFLTSLNEKVKVLLLGLIKPT